MSVSSAGLAGGGKVGQRGEEHGRGTAMHSVRLRIYITITAPPEIVDAANESVVRGRR